MIKQLIISFFFWTTLFGVLFWLKERFFGKSEAPAASASRSAENCAYSEDDDSFFNHPVYTCPTYKGHLGNMWND